MRILIVDNDARIVELVSWFLEQKGFEVDRASSFARAREHLARGAPDLMLSDLDLGAEDGREELWALAREGLLPPVLVVSGYLSPEVLDRLDGLPGLQGALAKPFDFEILEERIRRALGPVLTPMPPPPGRLPEARVAPRGRGSAATREEVEDENGWIEIRPGAEEGM